MNKHTIKNPIAIVRGDKSGIEMDVYTEEPGVQLYTGNGVGGRTTIRGGAKDSNKLPFV